MPSTLRSTQDSTSRYVQSARYDETCGLWRVSTVGTGAEAGNWNAEVEYIGRWLVVAAGENDGKVVPEMEGLAQFGGDITHVCAYRSSDVYRGKRALVVGCGNSGMGNASISVTMSRIHQWLFVTRAFVMNSVAFG